MSNSSQQFAALSAKSATCMSQLLEQRMPSQPVPWANFSRMMVEMGFTLDAATGGSSVRFDPPEATARSVSLHKPHPGSYIEPVTLHMWGKKLREFYEWDKETFDQARSAQ
ncbi:unnamed protein product [Peniophora sp. CBMAI 1063]|nr:unnamed protein product [Peniophora sp. CBMAI 1063]